MRIGAGLQGRWRTQTQVRNHAWKQQKGSPKLREVRRDCPSKFFLHVDGGAASRLLPRYGTTLGEDGLGTEGSEARACAPGRCARAATRATARTTSCGTFGGVPSRGCTSAMARRRAACRGSTFCQAGTLPAPTRPAARSAWNGCVRVAMPLPTADLPQPRRVPVATRARRGMPMDRVRRRVSAAASSCTASFDADDGPVWDPSPWLDGPIWATRRRHLAPSGAPSVSRQPRSNLMRLRPL